jgi:transposase
MRHRAAIEGTISEVVRKHDLRHNRYRGLANTQLQAYFTGAAINLKRLMVALQLLFYFFFAA